MVRRFRDRHDAGRLLADRLTGYAHRDDVLVLALPRGGVPVGYEVARALRAPLDVFLVRKLGVPGHEELAMGAVATGGVRVLNRDIVTALGIGEGVIDEVSRAERRELARREQAYRGDRPPADVRGRTVILVDDGLATGATMQAAIAALRQQQPARIVVAVPTASADTCDALRAQVDEVVCAVTPEPFHAVGLSYEDFSQTTDDEVRELLARATAAGARVTASEHAVRVDAGPLSLEGDLTVPEGARGVVLFAHGSGSSRLSPRNRHVARLLNGAGLATLLVDLLTADEEAIDTRTARLRFDIGLLAERLIHATDWLGRRPDVGDLPIGYFGASTGAAAALVGAAARPAVVRAVVSRGGRPDLAGPALASVSTPTLLIVGANDVPVIELNRQALARLACEKRLVIVPGATHLFEEPGALDQVARLARDWFDAHLGPASRAIDTRSA